MWEGGMIKKCLLSLFLVGVVLMNVSCASDGYNTQKGAFIGAGLGAIAGQIIGNNTAGTLIGAASGALAGAIVGNAIDQDEANRAFEARERQYAYGMPLEPQEQPPGRWVMVPGQWVGGKWVPAHRAWVPVNPDRMNRH
jgi:surface antigen